jgi:hypothetical protein
MPEYTEEEKKLTERISKLIDNFPMDCTDGGDYSVCRPMITDSNTLAALIVKAVLAAGYVKIDLEKLTIFAGRCLELAQHGNYSNGNEAQGMDEGDVLASRMLKELEVEFEEIKTQFSHTKAELKKMMEG